MKNFSILALALALMLFLAACGGKETAETEKGDTAESSEEPEVTEEPSDEEGDAFSGYTRTGNWPDAATWESYGLPDLTLSENVDGAVKISNKDQINNLSARDGIMYEASPADEQIDSIVAKLNDAGISGVYLSQDTYPYEYVADYSCNGTPMQIYISQTEGSSGMNPKITILVRIEPAG